MGHKREQKTKEIFEAGAKEHTIKQSKTPSFHCTQTNLAAPVDKQLRNKSALFVFTEVRTHCQTRQEVLFLQTTRSQQVAHGDETQGWKSNHSIRSPPATWGGSHATVRSCPMHFFCFRADLFSPRYSPVGACCSPSSMEIGGWFGEGCGSAEVNWNGDLVSEVHW